MPENSLQIHVRWLRTASVFHPQVVLTLAVETGPQVGASEPTCHLRPHPLTLTRPGNQPGVGVMKYEFLRGFQWQQNMANCPASRRFSAQLSSVISQINMAHVYANTVGLHGSTEVQRCKRYYTPTTLKKEQGCGLAAIYSPLHLDRRLITQQGLLRQNVEHTLCSCNYY